VETLRCWVTKKAAMVATARVMKAATGSRLTAPPR
jgi:hypothetical protein